MSVTFCRFGRNVRFVLLLAWETLLPTCRPLPVSSQTRDMVFNPDFGSKRLGAPGKRRPLPAEARLVNVAARHSSNSLRLSALSGITSVTTGRYATMRAVLFILIIAVLIVLAGVATGFINIDQI